MNKGTIALLLAGVGVAQTVSGQPVKAEMPVRPLSYVERTLPNGLRVYAIPNSTTSNVAVQVWYGVGAKDDPKGRSGFAHLFEHLMFKATANMPAEQMDRLTEDVGGYNNAVTRDDYTAYYEYVPSAHLEALLFAEADRMSSLIVDAGSLESERSVVRDELSRSTTARPYGALLSTYLSASEYSVHPYARSAIGNLTDLNAAKLSEVKAFHDTYYRPDNAVLVVSGNFDPVLLNDWVDKYFGPLRKPSLPIPRVTVEEPVRTSAAVYTVRDANAPLPAVFTSWHVPPSRHDDIPALAVLAAILGSGDASRLNRALTRNGGPARNVDVSLDTKQQTGNLVVRAYLNAGSDVQRTQEIIAGEILDLTQRPVSIAELQRAKAQLLMSTLQQRETAEGQAEALALGVVMDGDPGAADRRLTGIAAITARDVEKVASRYLGPNRSSTIRQIPDGAARLPGTLDAIAPAPTVQAMTPPPFHSSKTDSSAAPNVRARALPGPGRAVPPKAAGVVAERLTNGLTVISAERRNVPLVTISLIAKTASDKATEGSSAALSLAVQSMTKATASRPGSQVARQVEDLGATILTRTDVNGASIEMTVRADRLDQAVDLLADLVVNPSFPADEVERIRARSIDEAALALKDPQKVAGLAAIRVLLDESPFGSPTGGTAKSLSTMGREEIRRSHDRAFRPKLCSLVLVGDIDHDRARKVAQKFFGHWRGGQEGPAVTVGTSRASPPPAPREMRAYLLDMPGATQSGISVALPGMGRREPGFHSLIVANAVLGNGLSSRLNQELRIKRGLSYWAGSTVRSWPNSGVITAQTQTSTRSTMEAMALLIGEMRRLGTSPPTDDEVKARAALVAGIYGMKTETTAGLASAIREYVLQDADLKETITFPNAILSVATADVLSVSSFFRPTGGVLVVAGDAKNLSAPLKETFPNLKIVGSASLDLESPDLLGR